MPYQSNKDLPQQVKDVLPDEARSIWREVANSVLEDDGTEEKASASAWAAVKDAGYKRDGGQWIKKAEYQGRDVELNKPFRTPGESKKFAVYVKDGDKVKIVRFGDPSAEIKRDDPEARRNFRARHNCDEKKDKTTAGYWSCRMWEKGATVSELTKGEDMSKVNFEAEIHKSDEDKRLVYAWASVVTKDGEPVQDLQGDTVTVEELEKAAHGFMLNSREAGDMHVHTTGVGKVVESCVFSKHLQDAIGIDLGMEAWMVVLKIDSDDVWDRVKKGELKMLSIGGKGKRV